MNTKIYVGNLSFDSSEQDLRDLYSEHGKVMEIAMPMDRETNKPRGFAFVTMDSSEAMNAAIAATNGKALQGRALTVNEARPQQSFGAGGNRTGASGTRGRY